MALIREEDLITPEIRISYVDEQEALTWRDAELTRTDIAATVSDYPNADAYIAYRQSLRAWPSTSDFPDTRPTLGE